MNSTLTVDDLQLEVRWSGHRRTVGLTVDRGGELIVHAPEGCQSALIEAFVREKRLWIYTKLAEKEAFRHNVPAKEYVSGEGFPYLGRSHRLLLVAKQDVPLRLHHGRFRLLRTEADHGRAHFIRWYSAHARLWLGDRVERFASQLGVNPAGVEVRDLGHRWGSCGGRRVLNFHWATILLPASVAEYVVVHELVHLREPHHTPGFWRRVERALPDFLERKTWLAERGAGLVVV